MKVAIVFVLLFATVLCRPAKKVSDSSESSEEVVRRPAAPALRKQAAVAPQARAEPVQNVVAAATAGSDESKESSDEDEATAEATVESTSDSTDTASSSSDTASVNSKDSEDSDDDDDDTEESETEEEEDESSNSSESGESSTPAPATVTPVIVTEGPVVAETTPEAILPSIVTDTEAARGDSLGGYPSDYKSIVYVEDKSYHKAPAPYKSYEFVGAGKKMAFDMTDGNEVEKSLQVYKALQVHSDILEEDTSTPEVESQGLDASSGTSQDQEVSPRQAALPEEESTSTSDATTSESESSSTPEEEEEEESASTTSDSTSTSQESEDEESQSSEEATATPGAADSDSDESDSAESDSDEEGAAPETTTDMPVVITAK